MPIEVAGHYELIVLPFWSSFRPRLDIVRRQLSRQRAMTALCLDLGGVAVISSLVIQKLELHFKPDLAINRQHHVQSTNYTHNGFLSLFCLRPPRAPCHWCCCHLPERKFSPQSHVDRITTRS